MVSDSVPNLVHGQVFAPRTNNWLEKLPPKVRHHLNIVGAVSFHGQDQDDGDSAAGALAGELKGVVCRPLASTTE